MTQTTVNIDVNAAPARVFDVVTDYARYPDFLPELHGVQVLSHNDGVSLVQFEVRLIVAVRYTLRLVEDRPYDVRWTLSEAKMLLSNTGGWHFSPQASGGTKVTYELDVTLAGQIPKSVSTRLLGVTLPHMLQRFKERAESSL